MKTNHLLTRLALTCLLALSPILVLGQAPDSLSGATMNSKDSNWPIYNEDLILAPDGTFSATVTTDDGTFPASGTYVYAKQSAQTGKLSLAATPEGYTFDFTLTFADATSGTYVKAADYGGGTTDTTSGPFTLTLPLPWEDYDDFGDNSLDAAKWDVACWDGGNLPIESNGKMGFSGKTVSGWNQSIVTKAMLATNSNAASMVVDGIEPHSVLEFKDSDSLKGIELTLSLPSGVPQEMGFGLYAIDYAAGRNATIEEEPEGAIRFDIDLWYDSGNPEIEFQVKDPQTGAETDVIVPIQFDQSYRVGFVRDETTIKFYLNDELKGEFPYQNVGETFIIRAMNENAQSFSTYVDNVRVLRRSQETNDPDPVTVVSTPAGEPVVVQVGDVYKWNDSLDGVTLWGVWEDEDDGWTAATIQYVDGKQKINIGLYDQLTTNLIVDHPYVVDESGMIKVTEDTAYQYYQVTGVENGVIQTADDSVFPLSDTSWFFTNKAAAQEYYYSKVGYPNPKGWLWFDQYPWVYSHEEKNWLYFKPSGDKIHYYSVRDKAWREFTPKQP